MNYHSSQKRMKRGNSNSKISFQKMLAVSFDTLVMACWAFGFVEVRNRKKVSSHAWKWKDWEIAQQIIIIIIKRKLIWLGSRKEFFQKIFHFLRCSTSKSQTNGLEIFCALWNIRQIINCNFLMLEFLDNNSLLKNCHLIELDILSLKKKLIFERNYKTL